MADEQSVGELALEGVYLLMQMALYNPPGQPRELALEWTRRAQERLDALEVERAVPSRGSER